MSNLTTKQIELLQHTLGADSRYRKKDWGYRNHFCAGEDETTGDHAELLKMEAAGLVTSGRAMGYPTFWATREGAVAIGFKPYQLRKAGL